jgi:hypothetical protein
MPTQPRTAKQIAARALLTTYSAAWRGLTAANRAAWNSFAKSFTVVNSLGKTINLTGLQCYVKVSCVLALLGDTPPATPPPLPSWLACCITGIDGTAGTQLLELDGAAPASGTRLMLYASPELSPGVTYNNKWKYIGKIT